MQNPKDQDFGKPGYVSDYDKFVNETPYTSRPVPPSEFFQERAGHLDHLPCDLIDVTPKPYQDAKQDRVAMETIDAEYKHLLKEAMAGVPKKKVWRSSDIDLSNLNQIIAEPYKVIMESAATQDFNSFSQLKKDICSYFGMAMYRYGVKNRSYMLLIYAMRSLYWIAEDGGEIVIETDIGGFDYSKVFLGLNAISGKSISKNSRTWRGLTLYPAVNFPIDVKDAVIFQPLINLHPDFMKLVKKHKLTVYVTSDFNLAIHRDFLNIEELWSQLTPYWHIAHFQFPNDLKLYVFE